MRKNQLFIAIFLALVLSGVTVYAKIQIPGRTDTYLNDYAQIIDESTKRDLKELVSSIKQRNRDKIELIIAVFKSLEGWETQEFAAQYGEKWRLTKKGRDNGVILLVALGERRVTIGVGQNLKNILTDQTVDDIIKNIILPHFKQGEYVQGIKKGAQKIVDILNSSKIPSGYDTIRNVIIFILLAIGIFAARSFFRSKTKSTKS